jgi:class 3 adenylate cyclase
VEPPSADPGHRTFIGTVVFVDIVNYSQRLVTQQVALKTRLNEMITGVLAHVPEADRMILDTGDGAALCFLGDPEDALFAASNLRAAAAAAGPELALRIGINLGPVRMVKDVNGRPNILGDGINVAQRVMSFATPNQILVSRSYYEIVSRLSQEYAQLFQYLGIHRDKHVREHEVYAMHVPGAPAPSAEVPAGGNASAEVVSTEFVPAGRGATSFPPDLLAQMEAALARSIGPLARVIVRKTAGSAGDLPELCRRLAEAVPEGERAKFQERLGDLAGLPRAPRATAPAAGPAAQPQPATAAAPPGRRAAGGRPLSPDVLAEAAERLAVYVGPMARVLVKRAAAKAQSSRELYEQLVEHIDDLQARRRFAAATEELSES